MMWEDVYCYQCPFYALFKDVKQHTQSLSGKEELTLESDGSLFPKATATRSPPFHLSEELASSPGP